MSRAGAGAGICLELEPEVKFSKMGGSGNPALFIPTICDRMESCQDSLLRLQRSEGAEPGAGGRAACRVSAERGAADTRG